MGKVTRKIWGGTIEYEDNDTPTDVRLFNKVGKSPDLWLYQSRELYRSALYLMEERDRKWNEITHLLQAPIALMLGAYAIETLLKAVIVDAHCVLHGRTFDDRHAKQFLPKKHDLVVLVKQAKLRVNDKDRAVLHKLGKYSVWAGRYPIPLSSDGYVGPALFEAVEPAPAVVAREHPTWPTFKTLYPKLFKQAIRKTSGRGGVIVKPTSRPDPSRA